MAENEEAVRIAVVGAGAFGRNHLRVYRELELAGEPVRLVAVVDRDAAVVAEAVATYGVAGFATVEEMLASGLDLQAANVSVPTIHHAATAMLMIEAGLDVLIEKPIAASLAEADAILAAAEKHGRLVQVGHLERFNPAVDCGATDC